jgi:hypothetical protein
MQKIVEHGSESGSRKMYRLILVFIRDQQNSWLQNRNAESSRKSLIRRDSNFRWNWNGSSWAWSTSLGIFLQGTWAAASSRDIMWLWGGCRWLSLISVDSSASPRNLRRRPLLPSHFSVPQPHSSATGPLMWTYEPIRRSLQLMGTY